MGSVNTVIPFTVSTVTTCATIYVFYEMLNRLYIALHLISKLHSNRIFLSRSCILSRTMTTQPVTNVCFTTNEEDQAEVAKLQARLQGTKAVMATLDGTKITRQQSLPSVEIADGVHKYVLIKAEWDGEEQYFVTSKKGAAYHRNAAEPMINKLEATGYTNIEVTGGGRLSLDNNTREIYIYGFSYGFGLADHTISQRIIISDPKFSSYDVTYSNEGY